MHVVRVSPTYSVVTRTLLVRGIGRTLILDLSKFESDAIRKVHPCISDSAGNKYVYSIVSGGSF